MSIAKRLLNYLLFGNIIISLAAVSLTLHTYISLGLQPDYKILAIIFFGTICSYNLHAYLHPLPESDSCRFHWLRKNKLTLLISMSLASVVCLGICILKPGLIIIIAPLAFLTLLYSSHRILPGAGFPKIIQKYKVFYLALVWTFVTVCLPVISKEVPFKTEFWLLAFVKFAFILQICLLFDFRDRNIYEDADRESIIKFLDERKFITLFFVVAVILLFSSCSLLLLNNMTGCFLSMLLTELLVLLVFRKTLLSNSDYWYGIVVDGVLIVPGIVLYVFNLFY